MGVTMRGDDGICGSRFSYIELQKRLRADHPLRVIREVANTALKALTGEFAKLYSPIGRQSIPPERLMRALLLQAFYSTRSERQLVERIDHDLLFRWFVWLGIKDPCLMPRPSPRTAIGCWRAIWRPVFGFGAVEKTSSKACCRLLARQLSRRSNGAHLSTTEP
jgi:hypothetical protein